MNELPINENRSTRPRIGRGEALSLQLIRQRAHLGVDAEVLQQRLREDVNLFMEGKER